MKIYIVIIFSHNTCLNSLEIESVWINEDDAKKRKRYLLHNFSYDNILIEEKEVNE